MERDVISLQPIQDSDEGVENRLFSAFFTRILVVDNRGAHSYVSAR